MENFIMDHLVNEAEPHCYTYICANSSISAPKRIPQTYATGDDVHLMALRRRLSTVESYPIAEGVAYDLPLFFTFLLLLSGVIINFKWFGLSCM